MVAAAALLLATGCTPTDQGSPAAKAAVDAVQEPPAPQAVIAVEPASASTDVAPGEPVTVTVTDGTLTAVTLADARSERVLDGAMGADGRTWTSAAPLKVAKHYRLSATAEDAQGRVSERTAFFATVTPRKELETYISPLDGQNVGVGMPVVVRFSSPVKDRAAVEQALTVETSKPIVGSWSWTGDEEVHFRPKQYWPAYTDVTVNVDLKGVDAGRGVWGLEDRTVKFRTGSSIVSVVDVDKRTLTVRRNGKVTRVIPVTTGKSGFLTRNGIKVILEKHAAQGDGRHHDRHQPGRPGVLPPRRALRDACDLERRVRPRGAVVGRVAGPGQRQPRLRRHEPVQRDLALQPEQRRRRRRGRRVAAHPRAGQRLHRLERLLERLDGRQRPLTCPRGASGAPRGK